MQSWNKSKSSIPFYSLILDGRSAQASGEPHHTPPLPVAQAHNTFLLSFGCWEIEVETEKPEGNWKSSLLVSRGQSQKFNLMAEASTTAYQGDVRKLREGLYKGIWGDIITECSRRD